MVAAERKSFLELSELARLADGQHGAFTQEQAVGAGFSPAAITRRVNAGVWIRVLPRVYRFAGAPPSPRLTSMSAVLWAGEGSLVAFATAAREWGIEGVRCRKPEIWVPADWTKKSPHVRVHRGARLDRADRTVRDGIPITTATRTLIDVSGRLEDEALLAAMEALFRAGLVTPDRLAARLEALRTPGRVGAGRLERLLAARPAGAAALESRLEARVWRLLERSGLPLPERQLWVAVGDRRYRLDYAWRGPKVAVECKGFAFHGGREHFEPGERRSADLASAHWRVVPVTWHQATRSPEEFIERVARLVAPAASGPGVQ